MKLRPTFYLVSSLNWFANVLPMAVMVLLAQSRGMSLAQIGYFLGLYSLTVVLLELPSGAMADAIGRKRIYLLAGGAGILAKAVFLFAFGFPMFLLYAVLFGISRALASGALEAWFIDALQAEEPGVDLQPPLATANAWNLAALAVGTLVGSALPALFAFLPQGETNVLTPLSITLVASLVANFGVLVLTALVVKEEPRQRVAMGAGSGRLMDSVLRGFGSLRTIVAGAARLTSGNRVLLLLLGADLIVGVALTASENLWQPFFAQRLGGATPDNTVLFGVVLAGCFGMGMLGNLVATPVSRLLGKRYALVAGLFQLLQGLTFLFLAAQGGVVAATGLFWLTYVTRSAWSSPHAALFNQQVPGSHRSAMLSVQSLVGFAGAFIGSVALGPLAEATSISLAWTLSGGLVALGALLYVPLIREAKAPAVTYAGADSR
ncbi:MAG TPA: MFS transporter [Trueperaceae bacterium]|nr:MFS transporter [Trueperaceae bacterium]